VITVSIMLATINKIANVALPHIQGSLSAAQDQIAWVLTSYIVRGSDYDATDRLARRAPRYQIRVLISVGGFTLASALCGSATSFTQLVIYRMVQGMCGAGLVPLSQSMPLQFNPPERHGQAITIWGTGVMLGPISVMLAAGFRARLHFCPAEHARALEPAAAHPDARDRDAQPYAQPRRQHRHFDFRGPADPEHPDRAFAAGRAIATG
jgi:DHA2 family multidrug resistance protein